MRVVRVDSDRGFVYLDVNWAAMDDDTAYGRMVLPSFTFAPGSEGNAASDLSMRLGFVERLRASRFLPLPVSNGGSGIVSLPVPLVAS